MKETSAQGAGEGREHEKKVHTAGAYCYCQRHWNYLATEAAKDAKMKRMTMGDAYIIFQNIDAPDIEDELKGLAVQKIISLETHNGVTKDMMVNVIRYLMGLCFEPPEV